MLSQDGSEWFCDGDESCPAFVPNHRWGKIKSEWFFTKDDKSYCPEHIPDWVLEWRINRGLTYHKEKKT